MLPIGDGGERVAAMAAAIRDLAGRLLRALGVPLDADGTTFFPVPAQYAKALATERVWGMRGLRRVETPTLNVLMTNIADTQEIPESAGMQVECTYTHLLHLARTTASDLDGIALDGRSEDGATFSLLPEQVALTLALARGACPSVFRFTSDVAPPSNAKKRPRVDPWLRTAGPGRPEDPSFAWVLSSMGSGKTTMVMHAACFHIEGGWEACRDSFASWNGRPTNGIEGCPCPGTAEKLARVVLVVVPRHLVTQWERAIRRLKPALVILTPKSPTEVAQVLKERADEKPDEPALMLCDADHIIVLTHNRTEASRNEYPPCDVGVAALIMDEFDAWAGRMRGCKPSLSADPAPFISAFRAFAMTATPSGALRGHLVNAIANTHHLKRLLYEDPCVWKLELKNNSSKTRDRVRGTWVRFIAFNPAAELQVACGEAAVRRMPATVDLEVVRVPHDVYAAAFIHPTQSMYMLADQRNIILSRMQSSHDQAKRTSPPSCVALCGAAFVNHICTRATSLVELVRVAKHVAYTYLIRHNRDPRQTSEYAKFPATVERLCEECTDTALLNAIPSDIFCSGDVEAFHTGIAEHILQCGARARCASCRASLAGVPPHAVFVNRCCSSLMCEACVNAHKGALDDRSCAGCCVLAAGGLPASLADIRDETLVHTLHAVLARLLADGHRKLCIFAAAPYFSGARDVQEAAKCLDVDIFMMKEKSHSCTTDTTGDPDIQNIVDAARDATSPAACFFRDDKFMNANLAGMNMGFCDAIVVIGYLQNEQQAFSRALRMGAREGHAVKIVRVTFDEPTVDVVVRHPTTGETTFKNVHAVVSRGDALQSLNITSGVIHPPGFAQAMFQTLLDAPRDEEGAVRITLAPDANDDLEALLDTHRKRGGRAAKDDDRPATVPDVRAATGANAAFVRCVLDACFQRAVDDLAPSVLPEMRCAIRPASSDEAFASFEIAMPPVAHIDGDLFTSQSIHIGFKRCIDCDCVPEDACGVVIAHDGPGGTLTARWTQQGLEQPTVARPITWPAAATFTVIVPCEQGPRVFVADVPFEA